MADSRMAWGNHAACHRCVYGEYGGDTLKVEGLPPRLQGRWGSTRVSLSRQGGLLMNAHSTALSLVLRLACLCAILAGGCADRATPPQASAPSATIVAVE